MVILFKRPLHEYHTLPSIVNGHTLYSVRCTLLRIHVHIRYGVELEVRFQAFFAIGLKFLYVG